MGEESGARNLKPTAPSKNCIASSGVSDTENIARKKKSRSKDNVNRASKLMCLID